MAYFRKKPIVIEAVKWTGNMSDIIALVGHDLPTYVGIDGALCISTLEGDMALRQGDWLIKGVKGEFYPCRADIFDQTYEQTESPDTLFGFEVRTVDWKTSDAIIVCGPPYIGTEGG